MNDLNVKPGDRVVRSYGSGEEIVVVDHVTPTGRIRVGREQFDRSGRRMGPSSGWSHPRIAILTEEALRRIRRNQLLMKLKHCTNWDDIPLLQLEAIDAIIEASKPKET